MSYIKCIHSACDFKLRNLHTYHCDGSLHIKALDDIAALRTKRLYDPIEFTPEAVVAHCPLNRSNEPAHHPNNVKHKILGEEGRG